MSGSVSPLPWTGNKGCIYTTIDAFMPPHRTYVEACMGSAEVFLRKKPVEKEIINDYNGDLVRFFRVLQRNENLERLIGRLFLYRDFLPVLEGEYHIVIISCRPLADCIMADFGQK